MKQKQFDRIDIGAMAIGNEQKSPWNVWLNDILNGKQVHIVMCVCFLCVCGRNNFDTNDVLIRFVY